MSSRLSPAMESLLRSAADHPDGRAYNNGAAGFLRTHDALVRRGFLAEVDSSAGVITDAGRAAVGRPLTDAERAERARVAEAAERAAAERARVAEVAWRYGWQPAAGDAVTLPDGTGATVSGGFGARYACRECDGSHQFPTVRTEQSSIMGAPTCTLAPTVETARAYLLGRAAHLDREVAVDPGYPAAPRWRAEAAELRAAAAELAPVAEVDEDQADEDQAEPAGESAWSEPGDAERTAVVEEDAAELAGVRADEAAELAAAEPGVFPGAIGADDCGCPMYPAQIVAAGEPADPVTAHTADCREWAAESAPDGPRSVGAYAGLCLTCGRRGCTDHADDGGTAAGLAAAELAAAELAAATGVAMAEARRVLALRLPAGVRLTTAAELAAELDAGRAAMAERAADDGSVEAFRAGMVGQLRREFAELAEPVDPDGAAGPIECVGGGGCEALTRVCQVTCIMRAPLTAGRPYGDQDVIEQAAAMRERTGRPVTLGEARDALDAARTEGREQGS